MPVSCAGQATPPGAATAAVPSTGDVYRYVPTSVPLRAAPGRQSVYLVLSGGVRLSSFTIR